MELSEVLRQVLELDDDGSDWNVSEGDDEIDECDDMPTETTTLDLFNLRIVCLLGNKSNYLVFL